MSDNKNKIKKLKYYNFSELEEINNTFDEIMNEKVFNLEIPNDIKNVIQKYLFVNTKIVECSACEDKDIFNNYNFFDRCFLNSDTFIYCTECMKKNIDDICSNCYYKCNLCKSIFIRNNGKFDNFFIFNDVKQKFFCINCL